MSTKNALLFSASICLTILISGCSHTHRFNPAPPVGALSQSPISGRRIALDFSNTPESYNAKANGHSFTILGIRNHAQALTQSLFSGEELVANASDAEIVLSLSLSLDISGAFGGTKCRSVAVWRISTPDGQNYATGEAADEASFPVIKNAGNNCELASINAISAALDAAFAKMTTAAPPQTVKSVSCTFDKECPGDEICTNGECVLDQSTVMPPEDTDTSPTVSPTENATSSSVPGNETSTPPVVSTPAASDNKCAQIACSGHGVCLVKNGEPVCACNAGYRPDAFGLNCVASERK